MIEEASSVRVDERMIPMRDGVRLYTRAVVPTGTFRQDGGEKYPIVFIRTPYEAAVKGGYPAETAAKDLFVRHGYAVVTQHCRGRGGSEGECHPYAEREDGLDTIAYLRTLPFYNGEIFLTGGSYLSSVHLTYLTADLPDMKGAALSIQTDRMYFRNYRNGCCYSFCNIGWWMSMLSRRFPGVKTDGKLTRPYRDIMKRVIGEDLPEYTDQLLHETYDEYWQKDPRTGVMENLRVPVLLTEGWYDFYLDGMFSMWERMKPETRARSVFCVGPYGHGTSAAKMGVPFPHGDLPSDAAVRWFDSLRTGEPYPYAEIGKITYYSIGGDFWTTDDGTASEPERLYLSGSAPCGGLSDRPGEGSFTYEYDPDRRVGCFPYHDVFRAHEPGSVEGVTSFVSAPIAEETDYYGRIRWHMPVSSDCEDTAFFIRVYRVDENGAAYNLTETITSLSHFFPVYRPGGRVTLDLTLPQVAFTLKAGEGVRVDLASDGDIYVPHANVRGQWACVETAKTAHNTVYLDDAFIELPKYKNR